MAGADDAQSEGVLRPKLAPAEEHAGRVGNFAEHAGIARVGLGQDGDVVQPQKSSSASTSLGHGAAARCPASFGPTPGTLRHSLGAAASAPSAEPKRSSSSRRIRGPTPGTRIKRSVSMRASRSSTGVLRSWQPTAGEYSSLSRDG